VIWVGFQASPGRYVGVIIHGRQRSDVPSNSPLMSLAAVMTPDFMRRRRVALVSISTVSLSPSARVSLVEKGTSPALRASPES